MKRTTTRTTVLHLSSTSGPGGAEMIVSRLAASLNGSEFRSIACLFRSGWLKERCESDGIDTHIIPIDGALDWNWLSLARDLTRREKVALIHAHEFTANIYGTLLARIAGIPIVATIHGKNYYVDSLKRRIAYRVASRYARLITVSEDLRQYVVDRVGVRAKRIGVIYNGIEVTEVLPIEAQRCRRELGLQEDEAIVGLVGSLYPVKGHTYLLHAIPEILKACPRTKFLIVGRGDLDVALKDEVSRLGLEENVHFLGLRNDVRSLLEIMDVFVLPSLSEGLSIALLEAMAAGKPVVASAVGGNPELVLEGETGFLVPPKDSHALAWNVVSLLKDSETRKRFGQTARKRVEHQFTLEKMVESYQGLYRECMAH
jgi:glycosyltransferase involved in cell wall biosynthesis